VPKTITVPDEKVTSVRVQATLETQFYVPVFELVGLRGVDCEGHSQLEPGCPSSLPNLHYICRAF
jgi:hypothetical protein